MRLISLFPLKHPTEVQALTFDFTGVAGTAALASATVAALNGLGVVDPSPAGILSGAATVSGLVVTQKVIGGLSGATYELQCTATDTAGNSFLLSALLPVISF